MCRLYAYDSDLSPTMSADHRATSSARRPVGEISSDFRPWRPPDTYQPTSIFVLRAMGGFPERSWGTHAATTCNSDGKWEAVNICKHWFVLRVVKFGLCHRVTAESSPYAPPWPS